MTAKSSTTTEDIEELDLAISNMDTQASEEAMKAALKKLAGISSSRLVERGALIHYHRDKVSKAKIVETLKAAGFDVITFQDSATGETGKVDF